MDSNSDLDSPGRPTLPESARESWLPLLAPCLLCLLVVLDYFYLFGSAEQTSDALRHHGLQSTIFGCVAIWLVALGTWQVAVTQNSTTTQLATGSQASEQLKLLVLAVERASQGDLTVSVESSGQGCSDVDPLVRGFEDMLGSLRELVRNIQQLGVAVKGASTQLAGSTTHHESIITEQAATTTELSATLAQISATSQQLNLSVASVNESARSMSEHAGQSQQELEAVLAGFKVTEATSHAVGTQLASMEQVTSRIGQVTESMMQLAAQANLLSLNAAIEAEKAGEAGRGFSVVALEIRRLADHTAASASEIETSLTVIRATSSATVSMVGEFLGRVNGDSVRVTDVGEQVGQILVQMQMVSEQIDTIQQGTESQSQGSLYALEGLQQLNEAVLQTLSSVRETVATAQRLETISSAIHTTAGRFTVPADGVKRPKRPGSVDQGAL